MTNKNTQNSGDVINIVIDKPEPPNYDKIWISFENTIAAAENLSSSAFMLYMCLSLATDKNSYPLLGSVHSKLSSPEYNGFADAMNELFANHYLTIKERDSDTLYFHDSPLVPPCLLHTGPNTSDNLDDDEVW